MQNYEIKYTLAYKHMSRVICSCWKNSSDFKKSFGIHPQNDSYQKKLLAELAQGNSLNK